MNNFGRFSYENQFYRLLIHRKRSPFPHKGRLINLSLSVLDLHQSIVGSIDYGSLLQWEKVAERSEVG